MSVIAFSRSIGPVPIDVVLREKHVSDLTITKVPVEIGADMTDHAFVEPSKLSLEIADKGAASTWAALERFQASRVPFTVVTGLKVYTNMLISHIDAERDSAHGRILYGRVDLDEVLIAHTGVEADAGGGFRSYAISNSGQPGGTKSTNAAKPHPSNVSGAATKARSSGTVARGPAVTHPVSNSQSQSILSKLTN